MGEDQQYASRDPRQEPSTAPLRGAALAAELLERACAPGSGDPLRLEVVRALARDLSEELKSLALLADRETGTVLIEGVEGALRAADVASLAACTVPELSQKRASEASAAAHLAAGATRALVALVELDAENTHGEYAKYALRDVRGVAWRARLVVRQVDEFLEGEG